MFLYFLGIVREGKSSNLFKLFSLPLSWPVDPSLFSFYQVMGRDFHLSFLSNPVLLPGLSLYMNIWHCVDEENLPATGCFVGQSYFATEA